MRTAISLLPLLLMPPVSAAQITSTITDSVQLTVEGPAVQSTRIGSSYGVSGTNVSVTTLGGLGAQPSSSAAPAVTTGTYDIDTDGQAFSFSESATIGDSVVTSQTTVGTDGRVTTPNLYGNTTQSQGGTAQNLAGTLSATSIPTVTAGGAGTTAIGQRTVELSVFQ